MRFGRITEILLLQTNEKSSRSKENGKREREKKKKNLPVGPQGTRRGRAGTAPMIVLLTRGGRGADASVGACEVVPGGRSRQVSDGLTGPGRARLRGGIGRGSPCVASGRCMVAGPGLLDAGSRESVVSVLVKMVGQGPDSAGLPGGTLRGTCVASGGYGGGVLGRPHGGSRGSGWLIAVGVGR